MELHRSLDRTSTSYSSCIKSEDAVHDPGFINTMTQLYNIVKLYQYKEKLNLATTMLKEDDSSNEVNIKLFFSACVCMPTKYIYTYCVD